MIPSGALQQRAPADPAAVRSALDEVLARREFQQPGENPLARALEWLLARLDFGGLPDGAQGLAVVGLVLLLAALTAWTAMQLLGRRRALARSAGGADPLALARRVEELRAQARHAHQQGDLPRALRLSFLALVLGLGERGDLEYRDGWTNRELFERGRPAPEVARELAPLVGELDRRSFGGQPVRDEDVEQMQRLCARWLDGKAAGGAA